MGQPISFGSSLNGASIMKAQANLILDYIPPGESQPWDHDPVDKTLYVHGVAYPDPSLPAIYTNIIDIGDPKADVGVVKPFTFQQPLMSSVFHWADMQIDWQFVYSVAPPPDLSLLWNTFNSSHNANYITLNTSQATKLYLTLADYTTLAAHGEVSEPGVVSKMWDQVSSLNVYRSEDGQPLKYYGDWHSDIKTLAELLKEGDSQCFPWAELWNESLLTHAISTGTIILVTTVITGEGFLIKNWDIATATPLTAPRNNFGTLYPFENEWRDNSDMIVDNQYNYDVNYMVKDQDGLPGQTNSNPRADFKRHFIVKFDNAYYDPSYGKTYTNPADMEIKSISGYFYDGGIGSKVYIIRPVGLTVGIQFSS